MKLQRASYLVPHSVVDRNDLIASASLDVNTCIAAQILPFCMLTTHPTRWYMPRFSCLWVKPCVLNMNQNELCVTWRSLSMPFNHSGPAALVKLKHLELLWLGGSVYSKDVTVSVRYNGDAGCSYWDVAPLSQQTLSSTSM